MKWRKGEFNRKVLKLFLRERGGSVLTAMNAGVERPMKRFPFVREC